MDASDTFIPAILAIIAFVVVSVVARLAARRLPVPLPVILVFTGLALAQLPVLPTGIQVFLSADIAHKTIIYVLLPLLIFEAAYRFDVSKLTANMGAVTIMALPGVLFSTLVITAALIFIAGLTPEVALILGIILSATDPSATIAIFKESGAPKDLVTIVEGESLLNDATVIALYKIAVLILAVDLSATQMLLTSIWQLLWLFGAGALFGWLCGHFLIRLMSKLPDEAYIEISISLITATGCFIIAEEYLSASGIIALTACGLVLSQHTPLPLSSTSARYLDSFWSYLSDLAKAFVFILVGMWLDIGLITQHWLSTLLVVISMLAARSILVYGMLPFFGRLRRHAYTLPASYQHICLWGGLRGAVTLALAILAVTHSTALDVQQQETLLAIAMGAVAFTIVIQGLTLSPLARRLNLNNVSLDEQITQKELLLSAMNTSKQALTQLIQSPLSTNGAPQKLLMSLKYASAQQQKQLQHLYSSQAGTEGTFKRLIMRGLSIEAGYLHLLFEQGIISAEIYHVQKEQLDREMDAARHTYQQPVRSFSPGYWKSKLPVLKKSNQPDVLFRYEMCWARLLTSEFTLTELQSQLDEQPIDVLIRDRILSIWRSWHQQSENMIHQLDMQHPLLTAEAQVRWLNNMLTTVQKSHLNKFVRQKLISESDCQQIKTELNEQMNNPGNRIMQKDDRSYK